MQYLGLSFGICLLCSSLGFYRVVYFVSLGYAPSIAAQVMGAASLYSATVAGWPLIQVLLLLAYGIRLGGFLMLRDRDRGYRAHEGMLTAKWRQIRVLDVTDVALGQNGNMMNGGGWGMGWMGGYGGVWGPILLVIVIVGVVVLITQRKAK